MNALSPEDRQRLDQLFADLRQEMKTYVGYPCATDFDYHEVFPWLTLAVNNVGDPFTASSLRINTKDLEREVVRWFEELTHADPGQCWGYVTNGGSEGNLYGLYLARELMPDGMVYYSQDTHYSVAKNLRMLKMPNIMIRSRPDGSVDIEDLRETIRIHREVPPIIFANIGTTMREGIDSVSDIRALFRELALPRHYIHADAALSGMTLPFLAGAPAWDFSAGVDSLSISGHKFIGSPIPCGIVLARKTNVDRIARSIEYVGTLDTTVTGSRNGITPLLLWYAIRTLGREGFARRVAGSLDLAQQAVDAFTRAGLRAWRNPLAITVTFDRPPAPVLAKWQLAVQDDIAHIILMPGVTRAQVDELVADIVAAREEAPP